MGRRRRLVALLLLSLLPALAACGGSDATAPSTTAAVTLTTLEGVDQVQLGDELLARAGATDSVAPGPGARLQLVALSTRWCTTALRSDVPNADATFRFSLNDFVTDFGVVTADGEVQDVPLARSLLADELAEPLAQAANELLCPEV